MKKIFLILLSSLYVILYASYQDGKKTQSDKDGVRYKPKSMGFTGNFLHKSLEYVQNPGSKAAVRNSIGTSQENAQARAAKERGGLSNIDLPRIAHEYWNYFKKGEGNVVDFISKETKENGYKPLGLLADDVQEIEAFIRFFFMSDPSLKGPIQHQYLELSSPRLPKFLENEYEHTTYDIIKSIVDSDDYSYLGPQEIRVDVAHYFFQKLNRSLISRKRYLFELKNSASYYKQRFQNDIRRTLDSIENQIEYIDNLEDESISPNVLYLVVKAQDLVNQKEKLEAILELNPDLQVIIGFDEDEVEITHLFKVPNSIKNLILVGRNIRKIGHNFLSDCTGLQKIDFSGLSSVTEIGDNFLLRCRGLQKIDFSSFSNVKEIGDSFLYGCRGLQKIDFYGLSSLEVIGDDFLERSKGLKQIDFSAFSNLREISEGFLYGCKELEKIKMTKNVRDLLPEDFFDQFDNLEPENIEIIQS